MKKRILFGLTFIILALSMLMIPASSAMAAGITTSYSTGAANLVSALLGAGVTASNIQYHGAGIAAGTFTGATAAIGFESGIILSSGDIHGVIGPNNVEDWTADNQQPGDSDLNGLIPGYTTYDAASLEFDFVPTGSTLQFDYVFGSEEYNEYVHSDFNDVFGFFLDGVNIALIPGTGTPVSINNVNYADNSAYYRDHYNTAENQLDGLTVILSVSASVVPGNTHHIKLAIADAGDFILDSDVFIKAGSFTSIPDLYLEPLTATNVINDEHTVTATAKLDNVPQAGITVNFSIISGPNTGLTGSGVTNSNGQASWTYNGAGGVGTDTIQATATIGGSPEVSNEVYKTWELPPNEPPVADAGDDATVEVNTEGGAIVTLDASGTTDDGNILPLTYTWSWMEDGEAKTAVGITPTIKLPVGTTDIVLEVYDGEFTDTDDVSITVEDTTAPSIEITCEQGTNPHGNVVPGAQRGKNGKDKKNVNPDGFYKLIVKATDYSGVKIYIGTADDPFLLEINNGETMQIKFTEDPTATPQIKKIGSTNDQGRADAVEYHIILPSDPVITAVDGYGNATDPCTVCVVPPPPM